MEAVAPSPELTSIRPLILSAAPFPSRALEVSPAKAKRRGESAVVHYALLLAIMALGGVLRFICLDRPSIWGDEAATFGRASGTFTELMARLQSAGFAPTHYELLWWIGQHTLLTPFMMRLVPAITGTLMIPAMYWLAAQLIGRRAALLTALLTATNAFLLSYSRDAKMYSPFWFFAAVNVAALIWWLRVRTPLSWCLWLASGTAMVGFDALGWITIAIELLMVLTARRGNWLFLPHLIFLSICAAALWSLTLGLFFFPMAAAAHDFRVTSGRIAIALLAFISINFLALVISVRRRRSSTVKPPAAEEGLSAEVEASGYTAEVLLWPADRIFVRPWLSGRIGRTMAAFRWPPVVLFIFGLGIMLAGPFGYYYDFNRFLQKVDERGWRGTGIDWVEGYDSGRDGLSLLEFTASSFLDSWEWPRTVDENSIQPRTRRLLTAGTLSIAAVVALGLLPFPWSRRLHPRAGVGGWRSALWLILWLTLPLYAFYCVSIKEHVDPQTWLDAARSFLHDRMWLILLIGLAIAWVWTCGRNWQQRFVRPIQFAMVVATPLLLMKGLYLLYPKIDAALAHSDAWKNHGSVWMPRYVAVILPAFLIIASVLLFRIPSRPLRWACVLLVVIVNLSVHGARVFAGSEQPSPLMARDILDSQRSEEGDNTLRAYFQPSIQGWDASPGNTALYSAPMRYYVTILSPRTGTPINAVIAEQMHYRVHPGRNVWMSFTGYVINDVRRFPKLHTFITWEKLSPHEIDVADKPLDALEPDWKLASEQTFAVRDHWRWKDACVLRRRVYLRTTPIRP